jgi:hypothetical protein
MLMEDSSQTRGSKESATYFNQDLVSTNFHQRCSKNHDDRICIGNTSSRNPQPLFIPH